MKNLSLLIKICTILYCILASIVSHAQNIRSIDVEKLKNAYPANNAYSNLNMFAELNGVFYFNADDGIHGAELWRSDGTEAGTWLVKDINPGVTSSNTNDIIASGSKIFFSANDGVHGPELWASDGTAAGTYMVADVSSPDVEETNPSFITDVNGTVYFVTSSYYYSKDQLWKTDGTQAGTSLVADLSSSSYYGGSISQLTNVNGTLFFTANTFGDYSFDNQLFATDGTTAGTYPVKDIYPDGYDSPSGLTALNGLLYFTVQDSTGPHLWVSNGTTQGTNAVNNANNIYTPLPDPLTNSPLTINDETLFFQGYNASGDTELYRYNTSDPGNNIELVKDIVPGQTSSNPGNITNVSGTIFFTISPDRADAQLWKTDGTENGTTLVKDINPGGINSYYGLVGMGSTLMFGFSSKDVGTELWKSDGTGDGTKVVKDIFPGIYSSLPGYFTYKAGMFVFSANDGNTGFEFWKSDGTTAGTVLVKNINNSSTSSSSPYGFTGLDNNKTFFIASTAKYGRELWVTNGQDMGTRLVKDIYAGSSGSFTSYPDLLTRFQNNIYFFANDSSGYYLGKTDGTQAGTTLFHKLNINDYVQQMVATDNLLYFIIISSNTSNLEIWRTDGTAAGTYAVFSTIIGYFSLNPVGVGNTLFFINLGDSTGLELWKTDGTAAGTGLVKDIAPGDGSSFPSNLYSFNGKLYFSADYGYGSFLWTSDATDAGTKMVKAVTVAYNASFAQANNKLFFNGFNTTAKGNELYATDGTSAGTQLIKDINKGLAWSDPNNLVSGDTLLYFLANDGVHGVELWASNGTKKGTHIVKNITPGSNSSTLENMVNINDKLFFTMNDALWQSDATKAGTHKIRDKILNGTNTLSNFSAVSDRLYFTASNYAIGTEVYTVKVSDMFAPEIPPAQGLIAIAPATNAFDAKLLSNPVGEQLRLSVNIKEQQAVQVIITDALGRVLTTAKQMLAPGTTILSYNTKGWTSGIYMIKVVAVNGATSTLKAVK